MTLSEEERAHVAAVARAIAASDSGFDATVFAELVRGFATSLPFAAICISVEDADRQGLRIFWQNREAEFPQVLTGAHVALAPEDIRLDIGHDMVPLVVEDIVGTTKLDRMLRDAGIQSYVAVPIWLGNGVAWLSVAHVERGAPSQRSLALLSELGRVLAPALVRARAAGRDRLLAMLVDASGDGLVALDRSLVVREISRAALEMLGTTREAALERHLAELASPELARVVERALESGERGTVEVELHRPGGTVALDVLASPIGLAPEAAVLVHLRDARPRIEARARRMHADRLATIGALTGGVAHEINNPVAFITLAMTQIGRALASADRPELEPARLLAKEVEEANARIAHIVGELKLFTRIPEGSHATPVDVNRLVRTAVTLASAEIKRFGAVNVTYGDIPSAPGTYAALGPVFVSILLACAQDLQRAAPDGRELSVEVSTRAVGESVVVAFRDNGPGVAPDALPHLFDPFAADPSPSGTAGLGLALAHDLVRRAGGALTVASAPERGTTFEVVLPLADGPQPV
ncbi:MAG: PAS domain-containing protein [Myxococcales bacterium]|nr:PAS domain-containing protein [Myxococcales bacterium]